jgi:hypothetical protein
MEWNLKSSRSYISVLFNNFVKASISLMDMQQAQVKVPI